MIVDSHNFRLSSTENFANLEYEAHVWYCKPREIKETEILARYQALLSPQELDQLQRFHFKNDQHSYLVSHALLRTVLSLYAELQPQEWVFVTGEHGKPGLSSSLGQLPLLFNLTHTDGLCACVVTRDIPCGIDTEQLDRDNKLMPIAERMYAEAEIDTLRNRSVTQLRRGFFNYWTLREAYVKALGTGLSGSSKDFYFEVAPGDARKPVTAMIRFSDCRESNPADWQFEIFQHDESHVIAAALQTLGVHRDIRWRAILP